MQDQEQSPGCKEPAKRSSEQFNTDLKTGTVFLSATWQVNA